MNKIAFVFPGQGSQSVGMLSELADFSPVITDCFSEASDSLGYDLWKLAQQGPAEALNQTHRTQPALLAASVAVWRLLCERAGKTPDYLAGHSLGEYSALVSAGVIPFTDAIKLVEQRGLFMQQAVPEGTGSMMAVIGLEDEHVVTACKEAGQGEIVSAVNFNSPGQVVIAGTKTAVERAGILCKSMGAKRALALPVSVPSHCQLMQPAADKLANLIDSIDFSEPEIPVINNVDVAIENQATAIKNALIRQLYSPVRWTETIQYLIDNGVTQIHEVGAGKVLSGLTKRIDKSIVTQSINTVASFNSVQ